MANSEGSGRDGAVSPVARRIIDRCGGIDAVAAICGVNPSWVYKWARPKGKPSCGTGGVIPRSAQERLLIASREGQIRVNGRLVRIKPADFFDMPPAVVAAE